MTDTDYRELLAVAEQASLEFFRNPHYTTYFPYRDAWDAVRNYVDKRAAAQAARERAGEEVAR